MKRFKVNISFEEAEEERRAFFAGLSYSERLRYYFKLRNAINFQRAQPQKGKILKVSYSHNAN